MFGCRFGLKHLLQTCSNKALSTSLKRTIPQRGSILFPCPAFESSSLFSTESETTKKVPIALVKQLREKTLSGVVDCRKALLENDLDIEKAASWLRKKGFKNRENKVAAEGLVLSKSSGQRGVLIELNSETDFVSGNQMFVKLAETLVNYVVGMPPSTPNAVGEVPVEKVERIICQEEQGLPQQTILEKCMWFQNTFGEKIALSRVFEINGSQGTLIGAYVHHGARYASLVELKFSNPSCFEDPLIKRRLEYIANQLAIQVVAFKPQFVAGKDVTEEAIKEKKDFLCSESIEYNEKEFFSEVVLLEQQCLLFDDRLDFETKVFVSDVPEPEIATIGQTLENMSKRLGSEIHVSKFVKWEKGGKALIASTD